MLPEIKSKKFNSQTVTADLEALINPKDGSNIVYMAAQEQFPSNPKVELVGASERS